MVTGMDQSWWRLRVEDHHPNKQEYPRRPAVGSPNGCTGTNPCYTCETNAGDSTGMGELHYIMCSSHEVLALIKNMLRFSSVGVVWVMLQ